MRKRKETEADLAKSYIVLTPGIGADRLRDKLEEYIERNGLADQVRLSERFNRAQGSFLVSCTETLMKEIRNALPDLPFMGPLMDPGQRIKIPKKPDGERPKIKPLTFG